MSLRNQLEKTRNLRQSMEEIIPQFVKEFKGLEEGETYIDRINKKLLSYQEIKYVYKKTRIKPFYYLIFLVLAFGFILVGYFDKNRIMNNIQMYLSNLDDKLEIFNFLNDNKDPIIVDEMGMIGTDYINHKLKLKQKTLLKKAIQMENHEKDGDDE